MKRQVINEDDLRRKIYAEFIKNKISVLPITGGLEKDEISEDKCNWRINWDKNIVSPTDQDRHTADDSIKNLQSQYNVS